MNSINNTNKKLNVGIATIIIIFICLCITTYALMLKMQSVKNNYFNTGTIKVNLNDGNPVIEKHEFIFEPGMTVEKDFFIENLSTWDVYYKVYFENIQGELSDLVEITVLDEEDIIFAGTIKELNRKDVGAANDILKINERKDLTVRFHFPENAGNKAQNMYMSFDMCADTVQTKNNPLKQFD